jgi:hypothetical protein
LGAKVSVAECESAWTALPNTVIVTVELAPVLVTVTLPFKVPAADGAKVTFKVAELPAAKIKPDEMPSMLNPAPERATFEMETLDPPVFVSVTGSLLLLPTTTFPYVKFVVLAESCPAALTVSVAVLLNTAPAELLTATVN